MQRQSTLLLSGLAGLTTLLASLPAIAVMVVNPGGTINAGDSLNFDLNIENTTSSDLSVANVTLTIASLTATNLANIELYLLSPDGNSILTLKDGGSNEGLTAYSNVTFTDAATNFIDAASAPVTGSYKPQGSVPGLTLDSNIGTFADFNSVVLTPGTNTWQLAVYNYDFENDANIGNITLDVTPVPFESDALPLMGATMLFGGAMWWKRKRAEKSLNTFQADEESVKD